MTTAAHRATVALAPAAASTIRALVVCGTRPEIIKLYPVIQELRRRPRWHVVLCHTGQHDELADMHFREFGVVPDVDFRVMKDQQSLPYIAARVLRQLERVLNAREPDLVIVQGDTTSAMAAALCAFGLKIPVVHIEAGLRTGNPESPYPEEVNRRLIAAVATLHYAPTEAARRNVLGERPDANVVVVGNTSLDAVRLITGKASVVTEVAPTGERRILVTMHRRERREERVRNVCAAIRQLVEACPDLTFHLPLHPNPMLRQPALEALGNTPRVIIDEPLRHADMVRALQQSWLVLTDSGGLQEEAAFLGRPVLVLRDLTDRPEAVTAGVCAMVGIDASIIVKTILRLRSAPDEHAAMSRPTTVFGDGNSRYRIADSLEREFIGGAIRRR